MREAAADNSGVARRRPTAAELIAAHQHLVGLEVYYNSADGGWATVEEINADVVNGVAILAVDFDDAGRRRIPVIRKRTPRGLVGNPNVIRLTPGPQLGPYSWSAHVVGFDPPPEAEPDATFRVRLPAQTWQRVAKRRKQQLALMLGKTFADAIQSSLTEALEELQTSDDCSITAQAEATERSGNGDWFDIDIHVAVYGVDETWAHALYERVRFLVDSAADNDSERWTVIARDNAALRRISAASFTIDGTLGEERLPSYSGRLILR